MLISVAGVLATRSAHADGYRLPVALGDLVGGGALAGGVEIGLDTTPGTALAAGGLLVAGLAAPVIHGAEGNPGRMVASLILRTALPAAGWFGGMRLAPEGRRKFRNGGGLAGLMIGYTIATIVDIAMASTPDNPSKKRTISFGMSF